MIHSMELVDPSMAYAVSFEEAIAEFKSDYIHGFNIGTPFTDIASAIGKMQQYAQGIDLPDGWVPCSTYWFVENNECIGIVNIRHQLSPYLEQRGGHIGYSIRPSKQKQGYGTELLRLSLLKTKELGIDRVLLTCDKENIGSRRVIEKNAGKLQDIIEIDGESVMRFWIENT